MVYSPSCEGKGSLHTYLETQREHHPELKRIRDTTAAAVYAMLKGWGLDEKPRSDEVAKRVGIQPKEIPRYFTNGWRQTQEVDFFRAPKYPAEQSPSKPIILPKELTQTR